MFIQILVLAVIAAVVLYQLYATLGRRVGRQPEDAPVGVQPGKTAVPTAEPVVAARLEGVAALRARQPDFDPGRFLNGARGAYEMIVKAFATGDRETLKPLLADDVMANFEAAIVAREAEGRTETVEFMTPPRVDLEDVAVDGDNARAVVRILAEVRARSTSAEGDAVDDRRTAELWTFERNLKSSNPNWALVHVAAAEA
ncbi:TIM44-related membrane protein TimA [Caulobacter sp.]|uniref:TIM44-related membrane protein TimA n=1 Tax=Caulobacter sp. TaxID=78 RepID=UPI003BAC895D